VSLDDLATLFLLLHRLGPRLGRVRSALRPSATVFSAEHETEIRHLSRVEQELRRADLERELSLVFQPIVDAERTTGFEALARWHSPTLGAVPPDVFIKVAERSDLINRLTECLLRRALADACLWPPEIGVSFNLSTRDVSSVEAILRRGG